MLIGTAPRSFFYIYYLTAAVALAAILVPLRCPKTSAPITALTLILGIGLLCVGAYIAYAGGKVRHREFRNEPPPNASNGIAALALDIGHVNSKMVLSYGPVREEPGAQ